MEPNRNATYKVIQMREKASRGDLAESIAELTDQVDEVTKQTKRITNVGKVIAAGTVITVLNTTLLFFL